MEYTEVKIVFSHADSPTDIAIAALGEAGFESFVENENGISGYVPSAQFDRSVMDEQLALYLSDFEYSIAVNVIPHTNWNETWESSFNPIEVEDYCRVRAPFHAASTDILEIVISPKMSFGTGHHDTTYLMLKHLFEMDVKDKAVLDMGCGTGVLAIAAEKLGASGVLAVDIEENAAENARENLAENGCNKTEVLCGDREVVKGKFDMVLANINRNVLIADMGYFARWLGAGGLLLLSGFFNSDVAQLRESATEHGFSFRFADERNGWACILLQKGS